jgi:pimeloyl-ACP methyl ester carboxylesterase
MNDTAASNAPLLFQFRPVPAPAPAREAWAEAASARLWYWDTGGEGEVILLSHPASQSALIWGYQQPAFVAAGYRVIAYSRRGHYNTEVTEGGDADTSIDDLACVLDAAGVERAHLVGAAAGGGVAMGFAVSHRERVRTLVLAGSIVSPDEQEWRDMYSRLGMATGFAGVGRQFLELGPSYRAANPEGTALFAELEERSVLPGYARQALGAEVTWRSMASMDAPTLLLTGEADLYAPPPLQRLFRTHLPQCELHTIAQVGHALYWEAPERFNDSILEFVARHSRPG